MTETKALFMSHVLRFMRPDSYLAEVFVRYCEVIPPPFWTAPTSSSGKHHPPFANGTHGLVRHSVAAVYTALDFIQLWGRPSDDQVEALVLAAAVHDSFKGGDCEKWEGYAFNHAHLAADRLLTMHEAEGATPLVLLEASAAIRTHMSVFGPGPVTIGSMRAPAAAVTMADYVISRKSFTPVGDLQAALEDFGWVINTKEAE